MTFGVALCVRSNLRSGVISSIPMSLRHAGEGGLTPGCTIGGYTNLMNVTLVRKIKGSAYIIGTPFMEIFI